MVFLRNLIESIYKMEKSKITALIIEDDLLQQEVLSQMLATQHPEIIVAGYCASGTEALSTLRTIKPDLLFMDIDLGDMSAFDVLEHLNDWSFQIIFITAFNTYALQAFKVHAIDFLLKPIDQDDLKNAIEKALKTNGLHKNYQSVINNFRMIKNRYLKLMGREKVIFIPFHEIIYAEQIDDGTIFHLISEKKQKEIQSPNALAVFELELEAQGFLRIHGNCMIHPDQLQSFDTASCTLQLRNGVVLDVDPDRRWMFEW